MVPSCRSLSSIASRRFSMKYQLKLEQAMTRMRLKNNTNFVRRLRKRFAGNSFGAKGSSGDPAGFTCLSSLVGFIDETCQLLRKRNAQELRGLEIYGDLESLDRHGAEGQMAVPVENALCKQTGLTADVAIVDGHAEQRSQACELR